MTTSNKFVQQGDVMNVTAGGTVTAGTPAVVGTALLGIPIKSGVSGDVIAHAIKGVHVLPKVSGAVIAQGEQVLWDASAAAVDDNAATPATGDFLCGYAFEAAGNGVTSIAVDINQRAASVT